MEQQKPALQTTSRCLVSKDGHGDAVGTIRIYVTADFSALPSSCSHPRGEDINSGRCSDTHPLARPRAKALFKRWKEAWLKLDSEVPPAGRDASIERNFFWQLFVQGVTKTTAKKFLSIDASRPNIFY